MVVGGKRGAILSCSRYLPMTLGMRGPTFSEIRRQFGTRLALAWLTRLWRWGLAGPRAARANRSYQPRVRPRRRPVGRTIRAAEYVVIAILVGTWSFWAYLIVKGALAYIH
jgi:hypothetical protein